MKTQELFSFSLIILLSSLILLSLTSCEKEDEAPDPIENGENGNNDDNGNHNIEFGEFTDSRDGNKYKTVQIGDQIWMAENLKYLPSVVGPDSGSTTTPYYYIAHYDGTIVSEAKATESYSDYGVLYNWKAAISACPEGWKLPSNDDWTELTDYLGGEDIAGGKLKATGTIEAETGLWRDPNQGATNETGFTALPGSHRDYNGDFHEFGVHAFWWSSTEHLQHTAWYRRVNHIYENINAISYHKDWAFHVRCLKK